VAVAARTCNAFNPAQTGLAGNQSCNVFLILKFIGQHVSGEEGIDIIDIGVFHGRQHHLRPHLFEGQLIRSLDRDLPDANDTDVP
jgi:hypothetical protein